tara:strand:+ start:221 stop:640 length:420 start_codon:yes stop_codon:yes gene_type:complete
MTIFLTNCESILDINRQEDDCVSDNYLTVDSYLEQDENGYYIMNFLQGYVQTFTTLTCYTNTEYQKVFWYSNRQINIQFMNTDNWTDVVNHSSYTDDEGECHTVLGVWDVFVNDTVTVYSFLVDECNVEYSDSLKVIIR